MYCSKIALFTVSILLSFQVFQSVPTGEFVKCEEKPRDLFLVVDDSSSIGYQDIKKVRKFLSELVSSINVSKDMTRIGLLQFSDRENTMIRFNLDNHYSASEIARVMENLPYYGGPMTLTDHALKLVAEKVFRHNGGDRPDVADIVLVLTDGRSRHPDKTVKQANRLKNMGVRIIAIGVQGGYGQKEEGDYRLQTELLAIASRPEDVKMVDFANLENVVFEIVNKVCKVITTPRPPTTEPSQLPSESTKPRIRAPMAPIPVDTESTSRPEPTTTREPQFTTTPAPLLGCAGSVGKDILFLVDGTANFRQSYDEAAKDFKRVKGFIKTAIRDLRDDRFRVGVMQYSGSNTATMEIDFMSPLEMKEIKIRLGTIVQQRGYDRYTAEALARANNKFFDLDALKQREHNPNVVILITRGLPSDPRHVMSAVRMLQFRNIRLIAVGIHSGRSSDYLAMFLRNLTLPHFVFLPSYKELKKRRTAVLNSICVKANFSLDPGSLRPAAECRRSPHDIFFVIDGSASIKYYNFERVQIFLTDLVALLTVESSDINTGLMQYSKEDETSVVWDLGKYTEEETSMRLRNMKYQAGVRTATGDALTRVNNEVFTGINGDRPGISDIVIIFSDGNAHDLRVARDQAEILKRRGVLIITIAAGTQQSIQRFKQELQEMATAPKYAITVNFDELEYFAEKVFPLFCDRS